MNKVPRRVAGAFAALLVLGTLGLGTSAALAQTQAPGAVACTIPVPPGEELTANPGSSITLSLTASPGATSYNIYRSTTSGAEGSVP